MIGDLKITCDHFSLAGNFFDGCKDADFMSVRLVTDDWDHGEEKERLCGDLTNWIPLSQTWRLPDRSSRQPKGRAEVRDLMVRFESDHRATGTGFSCRVVGEKLDEPLPTTTTSSTSSTTSTTTSSSTTTEDPDGCPAPDDSKCACGRIKAAGWLPFRDILGGSNPGRIVGGQETRPHQYPWQVGLSYYGFTFCGGALISRKHVMTAAHCTKYLTSFDYEEDEFKVLISDHDLTTDEDCSYEVGIARVFEYPTYGQVNDFDSDYSIIELDRMIECSDFVSPVCLPMDVNEMYENRNAVVTGWGTLDPDTGEMPTVLYEVGVMTLGMVECMNNTNYDSGLITENMICAGEEGKDSCWGDSGGENE